MPPDTSRGPVLVGIIWTEACLAMVFAILRFYARIRPSSSLGWDDYTILLALVCRVPSLVFDFNGSKRFRLICHSADLDDSRLVPYCRASSRRIR